MSTDHVIATFIAVLAIALVHLASGRLRLSEIGAYSRSFAAGMALSYVFLHILPDLSESQTRFLSAIEQYRVPWFQEQVYLFALLGLLFFYTLHGLAERKEELTADRKSGYQYDMFSAVLQAALTGYIFVHSRDAVLPLLLLTVAFAAHDWATDRELLERYGDRYRYSGCRLLAAVMPVSWLCGVLFPVPRWLGASIFGFLGGGIIMGALHGELPNEGTANLAALTLGAVSYSTLLVVVSHMGG
jgi:hypothetical protein